MVLVSLLTVLWVNNFLVLGTVVVTLDKYFASILYNMMYFRRYEQGHNDTVCKNLSNKAFKDIEKEVKGKLYTFLLSFELFGHKIKI